MAVVANVLSSEYWEQCYLQGKTRWDSGEAAPPFVSLLKSPQAPIPGTMAVLGSGNGHDALLFSGYGFDVVGFDFAPSAVANSTSLASARGLSAQFRQQNIFELEPEFSGRFDYVLEHGCFCAIAPGLRPGYVQVVHSLLRPNGLLIALFWINANGDRLPFGIDPEHLLKLFSDDFEPLTFNLAMNACKDRTKQKYMGFFQVKKALEG